MVPDSLRKWFLVHFILDYLVAIPLMIAPVAVMSILGWQNPEPVATRLVAAALIGVGGVSLFARGADISAFNHMLTLKLLWSGGANLGLVLSIVQGAPTFTWVFLGIFVSFSFLWGYYKMKVKKIIGK